MNNIFIDGWIFEADQKMLAKLSPGKIRGQGVFETMRFSDGKIFALKDHLTRLRKGLSILKIKSSYSEKEFEGLLLLCLKFNPYKTARIRLSVWKSSSKVHCCIAVQLLQRLEKDKYVRGLKINISNVKRNERSGFTQIKSVDYSWAVKALAQAQQKGFDETIVLNSSGDVAEGSRTNIFFVKRGELFTPHIRCGCLPGITRSIILTNARELKVKTHTKSFKPQALLLADEVFLSNSLMGVVPVHSINGKMIGKGRIGIVTKNILKNIMDLRKK